MLYLFYQFIIFDIKIFAGILRMIVEHGQGSALPENQQNIAVCWGDDVRGILDTEEATARRTLRNYDTALEKVLEHKMRVADEEKARTVGKKRSGAEDPAWWTKEVSILQIIYYYDYVCMCGVLHEYPFLFYFSSFIF